MNVQNLFRSKKNDRMISHKKIVDLQESKPIPGNYYDNFNLVVWSVDMINLELMFISSGIEGITGYRPDDFFNKRLGIWENIIHHEDMEIYKKLINTKEKAKGKYRILHKDGDVRYVSVEVLPQKSADGEVVRVDGILTDVTEYESLNELIHSLQNYDNVTELTNRTMFEEKLNGLINKSDDIKFAIMSIDINDFSLINDALGYETGNMLLREIAKRLKGTLHNDDFISRMGNDEFTILISGYQNEREAIQIAKRIIDVVEAPYSIGGEEVFCTIRVGISFYPEDGKDAETLFKNAEIAMKDRTYVGNSRYNLFTSEMDIQAYKKFTLDRDLHKAFLNHEFYMVYQPKIEPVTGRMVGAEALLRWNHPNWNEVSPSEFMPIIEKNNMIHDVTIWIFKTVFRQITEWNNQGIPIVPISINLSPIIFNDTAWVDHLLKLLSEYPIEPSMIEIEITETESITQDSHMIGSLNKLIKRGIRLSLDDFGVGYSSLSILNNYQIETIKIDKKFTHNTTENGQLLLKSMIQVLHKLDKRIVCEGIETVEQLNFIRHLEVQIAQGFLISKPLEAKEFERLLTNPIISIKQSTNYSGESRRNGFRIQLFHPIVAEMTIISYQGKEVQLGSTSVLMEDIGIGGLRFMTSINLPVTSDVILKLEMEILHENIQLTGNIVWKENIQDHYQYGLQFILSEIEQNRIIKLLNQLELKMRSNPLPPGCSFYLENKGLFIQNQS